MRAGFNLAFFGSSLVSAYWNGAATYYRGIIRGLYDLGHRTTFYEPDAFARQEHRDIENPDWALDVVFPATDDGMRRSLYQAKDADVIVKTSGVGVLDRELETEVLNLKRPGNLVVFWDVDAPATLDRLVQDETDHFHRLLPEFDLILTYGGGPPVVKAYKDLGAKECIPIYNGLDPSQNFPVDLEPAFNADLSFLGNRLPDREARVEDFFCTAAQLLPEQRFLLAGSGWQDKPLPANVNYIGHLFTKDLNVFNSSARAVLNINRMSMARYGFSPATRMFEAAGAGACLITDRWQGLDHFLEPEQEVLVANNGAEVAAILEDLDPEHARQIGEAARQRVLASHTYEKRALEVQAVLRSAQNGHNLA
ncbi:MAG: glycosyltransferase [Verrucomicrobia bacterium]|nr:glycosyltransferase [Verrucomicrobiota bacterium]MBV8485758.1 glycosyltransferase [Verrucomicrobiota bacterium]